jgi:hypothetical protein
MSERKKKDKPSADRSLSLHPVPFEEAVADLLMVKKPLKESKKRRRTKSSGTGNT